MRFPKFKVAGLVMVLLMVVFSGCVSNRSSADPKACYEEDGWFYGKVIWGVSYDGPETAGMFAQLLPYTNKQFWKSTYFGIQNDLNAAGAFTTDGGEDRLTLSMFIGPADKICNRIHLYVAVHPRGAVRDEIKERFLDFDRLLDVIEEQLIEASSKPKGPIVVVGKGDIEMTHPHDYTASVESWFEDPDAGEATAPLEYSAKSSDLKVATASIDVRESAEGKGDATLRVATVGAGTATVTVTATDDDGLSVDLSFEVKVTVG